MAEYGVVRLDKIKAVRSGHLHSVVYNADILENGMVGVLGDLLTGERELRELKVPTGTTEPVVLVAHPEIRYEQYKRSDNALENFFIETGKPARAYEIVAQDMFSVSKKMVTPLATDVVVGNYVTTANGSLLLTEIATPAGTEAFLGKIVAKENIGTATVVGQAGTISRVVEFIVIDVIKNA